MRTKQQAIEQIIALIKEHSIELHELRGPLEPQQKAKFALKTLGGFIGTIFIFCGLGVYITQHWTELNGAARVVITLGVGVALLTLALIASYDPRYSKTVTPLFLIAVLFETAGLFVAAQELLPHDRDSRYVALCIFAVLFTQQILLFWKRRRTSLLFAAVLFSVFFIVAAADLMEIKTRYVTALIGAGLIGLSYGLNDGRHRDLAPCGYLAGGACFLAGLFPIFQHTAFELFYLGASVFIIYLSTLAASRALLFSGAAALIFYIGYFTRQHFTGSVGWPLALIFCGFIILGVSALAVRISKTISKTTPRRYFK